VTKYFDNLDWLMEKSNVVGCTVANVHGIEMSAVQKCLLSKMTAVQKCLLSKMSAVQKCLLSIMSAVHKCLMFRNVCFQKVCCSEMSAVQRCLLFINDLKYCGQKTKISCCLLFVESKVTVLSAVNCSNLHQVAVSCSKWQ
jgi:hypothetical protein